MQSIDEFLEERKGELDTVIVGEILTNLDAASRRRHTVIQMCVSDQRPPSDPTWQARLSMGNVFRHFVELPNGACISVRRNCASGQALRAEKPLTCQRD